MNVAVLSDIHGNADALGPVLDLCRHKGVGHLLILGDMVGYYYQVREVFDLLDSWPRTLIRGNHEAMLLASLYEPHLLESMTVQFGHGLRYALEAMEPEELQWLATLPETAHITLDGCRFALFHGTPDDPVRYLYPDSDPELFQKCHTHIPMTARTPKGLLVNPGSVGQARDIGGLASFALINTDTRSVTAYRLPYDTTRLITEVSRVDPGLPFLREFLTRGRSDLG